MSLDPCPSDAELLRRLAEREKRRNERPGTLLAIAKADHAKAGGVWLPPGARPKTHRNAPRRGAMNKTESLYAEHLRLLDIAGDISSWKYGALSLRLATRTWYRPDFLVEVMAQMPLEIHEVKGHWEDDARAKFKIAAELYPMFVFRAVRRVRSRDFVTSRRTDSWQVIETLND